MSSSTTATTTTGPAISLDRILEAKRRLEALPKGQWVLISPDGLVWTKQDPAELLPVLLPHHPLLKGLP